jgi:endonuclease/exonuclease/phosphatase family metal-dependent hydrolase
VGQTIQINRTVVVDQVLVIDTDRSIAGQDGEAFSGRESARTQSTFPARLAVRLFESDEAIDHVFVMSNTVSVRRLPVWSESDVKSATQVVADFFRFYP